MYQDLKLEKGMYHITGKSFSEVLEGMDPSGAYAETPLAGLDAYERQLKRFDIHVSGSHCDRVEKFFSTTDSAVLFPEFIRRAIRSGMEQSVLSDLVAVHTISPAGEYQPAVLTDTTAYTTKTTQGNALPTASYLEAANTVRLDKYGRSIHASYEAVRRQRLDAFSAILRAVGVRLSNGLLGQSILCMKETNGSLIDVVTDGKLTYADLAKLYGEFRNFDMTKVLAAPAVAAEIMAMEQKGSWPGISTGNGADAGYGFCTAQHHFAALWCPAAKVCRHVRRLHRGTGQPLCSGDDHHRRCAAGNRQAD